MSLSITMLFFKSEPLSRIGAENMKIVKVSLGLVLVIFALFIFSSNQKPVLNANAAILVNADTGEILFEKNANTPFAVASMSKMMTEYLVHESIAEGAINWESEVSISQHSADIGGASIELQAGDVSTIRDLYQAMSIASANNATAALAEHIAGSEEQFSNRMNQKAVELGLSQANFVNATGLTEPDGVNQMTATEVAKLARILIRDFPEVLETSSLPEYTLAFNEETIMNTNQMLIYDYLSFSGLDGLKTGFTNEAGYCFAGTAQIKNTRLITVVMGTEHSDDRFIETRDLLSYGFQTAPLFSLDSIKAKLSELVSAI